MNAMLNNSKLINETNKMLKIMTTKSLKNINQQSIEYILFHRNGICSAIIGKTLSNGEILILSRFLNLVFKNNLLPLTSLINEDFAKLLSTLLNGLKLQKDNYYWITTLSIMSQESIVEFFSQSKQMIRTFKTIFLDNDPKVYSLVRNTISSLSHLMLKLLECIISNTAYENFNIIIDIIRICCYIIIYLLTETGISATEIQTIARYLFVIQKRIKLHFNDTKHRFFLKHEVVLILKKLNEENILVCRNDVVVFLNNILPFMAYHLNESEVMDLLCKCCGIILQRSIDPFECIRLISLAGKIIYFGSKLSSKFLEDEHNVKNVMEFIKVIPGNLQHSDARNVLWWHILCSLSPNLFQSRFKTYFIPFLENILGKYLNKSKTNYGISEFNLSNGYLHLSQLTNHVLINIIDHLNLQQNTSIHNIVPPDVLVPSFMNYSKLRPELFANNILSSSEFFDYLMKAVKIWISILQYNKFIKTKSIKKSKISKNSKSISKQKNYVIEKSSGEIENPIRNKPKKRLISTNKRYETLKNQNSIPQDVLSLSNEMQTFKTTNKQRCLSKSSKAMSIPEMTIPTSEKTADSIKEKVLNIIKANVFEIPISTNKIDEMRNLLRFFKGKPKTINNDDKTRNSIFKNFDKISSKSLPLKKRFNFDFDLNPVAYKNQYDSSSEIQKPIFKSKKSISKIKTMRNQPNIKKDERKPSKKRCHFNQSDLYNNNSVNIESEKSKSNQLQSLCKTLPPSNLDFSFNVCESTNCPNDKNLEKKKNQTRSKKFEFRIKFDINPISKISTSRISLDNIGDCNIPKKKPRKVL